LALLCGNKHQDYDRCHIDIVTIEKIEVYMPGIYHDKTAGGVCATGEGGNINSIGHCFSSRYRQHKKSILGWWSMPILSALVITALPCVRVVFASSVNIEAERTTQTIIIGTDYDCPSHEFFNEISKTAAYNVKFANAIYSKCLTNFALGGISFTTTLKYAAVILVPLLVLLASSLILSRMVKRQVTSKMIKLEQEVAERKRAESALRLSEQCFRAIADYTYFWEIWVGPNGRPLWTNPAVERVTGYSIKELMEMKDYPMPLIYKEDSGKVSRAFRSALKGSTGKGLEFRIQRKDEKVIWASMSWQPIYDEKGASQGHRTSVRNITDRRHAEEALAHERDLLHILMENIPDTMYFKDTASRFTRINTAQAKLLGVSTPEEAVGKTDFDFFPRELAERYYADEQEIFQSGKPLIGREEPTIDDKGNRIWVSTTKVPLRDKEGNIVGLVGICRDITGHKCAEDALKLTQFALDNSADAAYWMGPDARFVYVNNAACRSLGYSRRELLNMTVHDIDPEFPQEVWPEHWEQLRRQGSFTLESHHRKKNGEVFPIEISVNYIRFGGKEYNCAFARDITRRKKTEEMLDLSNRAISGATNGIIITEHKPPDNPIIYVNPAFERITGYCSDEVLGRDCRFLQGPERQQPALEQLRQAIDQERDCRVVVHNYRKDGSLFWNELNISPVFDEQGKLTHFIGIISNITERRQTEKMLRESEQKFRNTVESSPMGIFIYQLESDGRLVLIDANPAADRILGVKCKQLIGKTIEEAFPPLKNTEIPQKYRLAASEGQFWEAGQVAYEDTRMKGIFEVHAFQTSPGKMAAMFFDITERKKAEHALQESKERYRALVENIELGITLIDADHDILMANSAVGKLFGESASEIIGKKCYNKFEKRGEICPHCPGEKAMKTGQAEEVETEGIRDDGSRLPVRIQAFPLFSEDGKAMGFIEVAEDITERKRVEKEIEKLAKFPGENPNPVLRISADGTILYCNQASQPLLELWKCAIDQVIPARWQQYIQQALASGQVPRVEAECTGRIFSLSFAPVVDSNYVNIYALDITDRKQAEAALRESEETAAALLNATSDAALLIDDQGDVIAVNKSMAESLGTTPEEIVGTVIYDYLPPDLAKQRIARGLEAVHTGSPVRFEDQRAGRWLENSVFPIFTPQGEVARYAIYSHDITERKKAEEVREKLNKELEEKNKELESILYVASHDLKSPLVNIQGFGNELSRSCELIHSALESKKRSAEMEEKLRSTLDKSVPEALGFILTSANKMDSLLSGLLRLSRLGSATMEVEPLNINTLLAGVADSMEYQIKTAGVKLEIEQVPSCIGDASQINQVFSNLLDNALKFLDNSRDGMIRIYGRVEGGQSIYCVEDNGVGIAPNHQNKIFEIFHQLEPDQKSGEGLGLTIVRRIIDRHNGRIWVESEPGKGSKFFVSLPGA
jgi:PAS domain S-box-containing protein